MATTLGLRELSALVEVGQAIGSALELDRLGEKVMEVVVPLLGAERGVLFAAGDGGALEVVGRRAAEDPLVRTAEAVSRSALARAVERGRTIVQHAGTPTPEPLGVSFADLRIRSLVCMPLERRGKVVGALYLDARDREIPYGEGHAEFLHALAGQLALAIENAQLHRAVRRERDDLERVATALRREVEPRYAFGQIVGESPKMRQVLDVVRKVTPASTTVLLLGESGTGKEVLAKTLHYAGPRASRPFVAINCAAVPETLLEAELFGIERNVATGVAARTGKFEDALDGTIFLDEIGDMAPALQGKLLRVLQEKTFERVGGKEAIPLKARIVAATNRNLDEKVKKGEFREDLYYRLNVLPIAIPPLRERREDVLPLADFFLRRFAREHGRGKLSYSEAARAALGAYDWPGNVREVENLVERAVLLSSGSVIDAEHLVGLGRAAAAAPSSPWGDLAGLKLDDARAKLVERFDRDVVTRALERAGGNVTRAAEELGIYRQRLQEIVKRLGISYKEFRE